MLEGPPDAHRRNVVRLPAYDILVPEADSALGLADAADAIKDGRLSGTVRADKSEQLALIDGEGDLVQHDQAAELQRDAVDFDGSHRYALQAPPRTSR